MAWLRPVGGAVSGVVAVLVAGALVTGATVTIAQAGCDDPGRYVLRPTGYELVGGCLEPGDLPVPPPSPTPSLEPNPAFRD